MSYETSFNDEKNSSSNIKNKQRKQKKLVDMEGIVTQNLSNGKFRLKLENGVEVIGHLSGKIRQNRIKIVVGDKVTVELSPYDLTKGRITYRHR
jgi:translation initiation factor IF-1